MCSANTCHLLTGAGDLASDCAEGTYDSSDHEKLSTAGVVAPPTYRAAVYCPQKSVAQLVSYLAVVLVHTS